MDYQSPDQIRKLVEMDMIDFVDNYIRNQVHFLLYLHLLQVIMMFVLKMDGLLKMSSMMNDDLFDDESCGCALMFVVFENCYVE